MRLHTLRGRRRALTLVEVLAVLIILGLVTGTFLAGFGGVFGQARIELAHTGLATLSARVEVYRMMHGRLPDATLGLSALGPDHASVDAPYFIRADQLVDPWGHPYHLIVPGQHGFPFEIVSHGADGLPGGQEDARDVSSVETRRSTP